MNGKKDDTSYYQRRAEDELGRAQQAQHPSVVAAHYELAEIYLERIAAGEQRGQR